MALVGKAVIIGIVVLLVATGALTFAGARGPVGIAPTSDAEMPGQAALRVGVFDSRVVALAYGRSAAFNEYVKGLVAEGEKARAAGDEERLAALEGEGSKQQERLHGQVFGKAPIGDILKRLEPATPAVAEAAGVALIVQGIVYRVPIVEVVDVTDRLVEQFNPDDETLRIIEELRKHPPVEPEQAGLSCRSTE